METLIKKSQDLNVTIEKMQQKDGKIYFYIAVCNGGNVLYSHLPSTNELSEKETEKLNKYLEQKEVQ